MIGALGCLVVLQLVLQIEDCRFELCNDRLPLLPLAHLILQLLLLALLEQAADYLLILPVKLAVADHFEQRQEDLYADFQTDCAPNVEEQVCEYRKGPLEVVLNIRQFGKVNHVLEYLADDHYLALDDFQWLGLSELLRGAVHRPHICSELQVCEDFDKLIEVFHHELEHSLGSEFKVLLFRFSLLLILQLLYRLLHDSAPVLIVETD